MIHKTSVQVVIVGGGIAGLWLLDRLSNQGMDVVLLEKNGLGNKQTLSSQGIIHGGLKYALNGVLSPASSAIAGMPERWRACLAGRGEVDLRGTRILSEHYYMWSTGSMRSRLKSFLGSK
ncbi:MAG: FAD-dependent oxidoreductase, partial [Pseudohongiella sp.]|nr:FAD-dependent oxidoreductase [Pseudohongiella sp.]